MKRDYVCQFRGGAPLPRLKCHGLDRNLLWAEFESARPLVSAEVNFTRATGPWVDRKFNRLPAKLDAVTGRVQAEIPNNTSVCFLIVFDDRGCVSSTPHFETLGKQLSLREGRH